MDLQAYLSKKYGAAKDSTDLKPKKKKMKKQKKKDRKLPVGLCEGVKIVDDDAVWQKEIKDELEEDEEDAPAMVEDEELTRSKRMEMLKRRTYLSIGEEGGGWVDITPKQTEAKSLASSSGRVRHGTPDLSPSRQTGSSADSRKARHDSPDLSPARRNESPDLSPARRRTRHDSPDFSPARRGRNLSPDILPPRRGGSDSAPARNDSPDMSPPRRVRNDSPDRSPLKRGRNDSPDISPPRRGRNHSPDMSPPRKGRNDSSGSSPPRRRARHDSPDISPPRRGNKAALRRPDTSPPRRVKKEADDLSPPRRGNRHDSPDISPPRRSNKEALRRRPDTSPPARRVKEEPADLSPPRRKVQRDLSPPRRNAKRNLSPPRRGGDFSPPRRGNGQDSDSAADISPPRRAEKSGLKTGRQLREEIQQKQLQDAKRFQQLDASITGREAETVYRDKHGRRLAGLEELMKQQQGPAKPAEKVLEWGSGLAQKREAVKKQEELDAEKEQPFARSKDALDEVFKNRVRWGDPMAHLVRQSDESLLEDFSKSEKMKESGFNVPQAVPAHSWLKRGLVATVNRYNIRPGRHWDGVDRSNGFEDKLFSAQNERKAQQDLAYKWAVEDM